MVSVGEGRRECDAEQVRLIANSMEKVSLINPIIVTTSPRHTNKQPGKVGSDFNLVAGRHRLEAAKLLGWTHIDAICVVADKIEDRLREIAENLFRKELTVLERSELLTEWTALVGQKAAQVAHPGGHQPAEKGISKAAKELAVTRDDIRRAQTVAGLSPEAKEAVKAAQLNDNQKALLEVAKQPTPEEQVEKVHALAARERAPRRKQSAKLGASAPKLPDVSTPPIVDATKQSLKTIKRSALPEGILPKCIFILSGTTADADTLEYIDDPQFAAEVQTFIRECRERRNAGDDDALLKKLVALASPSVVPPCQ
jgi:ParB family chromosome partitioning protein